MNVRIVLTGILKYYEQFKEEKSYEYERNSKRNMAK